MKWQALKEKAGTYEIRQNDGTVFGGIYINSQKQGFVCMGNAEENRYIFEFEDGMFSKSVKIYPNSKEKAPGQVNLGFTDSRTLEPFAPQSHTFNCTRLFLKFFCPFFHLKQMVFSQNLGKKSF
jgi:hypothetical protein